MTTIQRKQESIVQKGIAEQKQAIDQQPLAYDISGQSEL